MGRRECRGSQHASEEAISVVCFSGERERGEGGESVSVTHLRRLLCQILREKYSSCLLSSSLVLFSGGVVVILTPRTVNWRAQLAGSEIRGNALRYGGITLLFLILFLPTPTTLDRLSVLWADMFI